MITGVIFTALSGLVSNRCYPSTFPQSPSVPTWPAIRYQLVGFETNPDLCGTDDGSTDDTRVQIDYVAMTHGAAVALRDQGRAALMLVDPPCVRDGGFETYDADTKTHRASDDYLFHPSSEAS